MAVDFITNGLPSTAASGIGLLSFDFQNNVLYASTQQGTQQPIGGSNVGYAQSVTTVLTANEINSLSTTPVLLISPPGPNVVILAQLVVLVFNYGTLTFGNAGGEFNIYAGATTNEGQITIPMSGIIDQNSSQFSAVFNTSSNIMPMANIGGQGLFIRANTVTTGGTGCTLDVTTYFKFIVI